MDSALRLSLHPVPDRRAVVDGAWWPYSRDATAELPDLIAAVDQRLQRTTLLVRVHPEEWRRIPRRIPARGRQVRIEWFRHAGPQMIVLSFTSGEPVALLVIPPETAVGPAEAALKLTVRNTADLTHDAIFALVPVPPDPALRATADGSAHRGNEGGSVIGQETRLSTRLPT
ncbi:DUF5994 family protein [Rhizohabitans arisaemae]|uniref:DUF5994 family protein n=1 Tax=Rhizohabitans arisaemae TaxID=2720610 RepID=UPI0024B0FBB1|nr:DUF5994 family protein [Rhizohabitans arisaemae]